MKIGIITMHKVLNFGSALQAYALLYKLKTFGYESELIDYTYPKPIKKRITLSRLLGTINIFLRNLLVGFPKEKQIKKFEEFYRNNFTLSSRIYDNSNISNLSIYDGYVTGSDQVWNPRYAGKDVNFMLAFAPDDKPKISYASSFATKEIEYDLQELYAKYLSRYDAISVRESTGAKIVRELTGKDAVVCCDPTLLLNSSEWDLLAAHSKLKIKYKYVLVYPLTYMYNPYPKLYELVKKVQKEFGCKVIYLSGRKEDVFQKNSTLIKSAGPEDFIYLIKNAEFIITTSFHGAAFSMIYNKPMLGLVDKSNIKDSRIQSLLRKYRAEKSILDLNDDFNLNMEQLLNLKGNQEAGSEFITQSIKYLRDSTSRLFN